MWSQIEMNISKLKELWKTPNSSLDKRGPLVAIFNQWSCCQPSWTVVITKNSKNGYYDCTVQHRDLQQKLHTTMFGGSLQLQHVCGHLGWQPSLKVTKWQQRLVTKTEHYCHQLLLCNQFSSSWLAVMACSSYLHGMTAGVHGSLFRHWATVLV